MARPKKHPEIDGLEVGGLLEIQSSEPLAKFASRIVKYGDRYDPQRRFQVLGRVDGAYTVTRLVTDTELPGVG